MEPKTPSLALTLIACLLLLPLFSHARILTNSPSSTPASRVAFLQHLKGCHKGDKLNDIPKLKAYLHKFGYLDDYTNQTSPSNNHYFDGRLENALKTYQANYHLNVTGAMDSATVASMMTPRCGVADIVNGTNYMQTRRRHGTGRLHAVSHYSFFRGNPRWRASKTKLSYQILPGMPEEAVAPVARAFQTWAENTQFEFRRVGGEPGDDTVDIRVGFYSRDHGDGFPFDGVGRSVAHAFAPEDGRFHYDADESWGIKNPRAMDWETVALHEIGHLLGLDHSDVEEAIMFAIIRVGAVKGLNADDIQGIRALYNV
ncbi:unnamed protein product [Linum tenue]|uniref:Peptidase metallopeptidase domain-containing protein n=3 Tax=Linum tenue TaxID=586396 RepID=A0AAV0NAZ3_9ROSI|nr:unnamed protein product [Linum tenue]